MSRFLILFVTAIALAACTTPIRPDQAKGVRSRIGEGLSAITVTRDSGTYGSGCTVHVAIDGGEVGGLNPGQKFTYRVTPGQHEVRASISNWCGGAIQYYTATTLSGRDVRLSLGAGMGQPIVVRHDGDVPIP
jgi:hypothetical protein